MKCCRHARSERGRDRPAMLAGRWRRRRVSLETGTRVWRIIYSAPQLIICVKIDHCLLLSYVQHRPFPISHWSKKSLYLEFLSKIDCSKNIPLVPLQPLNLFLADFLHFIKDVIKWNYSEPAELWEIRRGWCCTELKKSPNFKSFINRFITRCLCMMHLS